MIRRSPRAPVCFLTACAATALSARDVKLPRAEKVGGQERIREGNKVRSSQQMDAARSE